MDVLTSGDTVRAGAECRARYSLCQHKQSNIKSLSCTKLLLIDLGLSSPVPLPPPSVYESRFENDCCIKRNGKRIINEQKSINFVEIKTMMTIRFVKTDTS